VKVYQEWADKIAEATNGGIKITFYTAGTLVPAQDVITGVQSGIADIADVTIGDQADIFPLNPTLQLPFMPLGDAESGYNIWIKLSEKFPEMNREFKDFKILFRTTTGSYALHTSKGPVRAPEDLKGVKIHSGGGLADVMGEIGAAPMALTAQDWVMSLERGLLEGMWMNFQGVYEMKCHEFLPYHTIFPSGVSLGMALIIMNLDSWNKLPLDVQKVFDDLSLWATKRVRQVAEVEAYETAIAAMEEAGQTLVKLTPDEEKIWRDITVPVIDKYIAKVESRGLPARAVYEEALRLAEEYDK
jgi:TRAP-type C4-dicarboxylate transport system substrate-binding protein